ncbi:MAG: amino acid ABC transporter ATP-binding protein [Pseudorhodobacter sp.]
MAFLEARNAHLHFGTFHALRGISVALEKSDVLVVCGPSGSGKSTFIRAINRLAGNLSDGQILLEGRDIASLPDRELYRRVGMVFQRFNLFRHLSALDNIVLPQRRVLGRSKAEATEHAHELLNRVGLSDRALSYPGRLSGGQQQRVAICRALAIEPELLLFDEPTSALDPEMVGEVLQVMQDLVAEGMTMIVVTHEMGFARQIANSVAFMEGGQLVEQARPDQFFDAPGNPRTVEFLERILDH